jgi:hypothetical protein
MSAPAVKRLARVQLLVLASLLAAGAGAAQPRPPAIPTPAPGDLVPQEVEPGAIAPDPGIVTPAPRDSSRRRPEPLDVLPPGGGDPGILAPLPKRQGEPPPTPDRSGPR